jgi:nucleotide-binding universal stress UspA family protein
MSGLDTAMHKHILMPTDGSALSEKAIEYGMALAKSVGAKVTVITVSPPYQVFAIEPTLITETPQSYQAYADRLAAKHLSVASQIASAAGVPCEELHVTHEQPYQAIIETAAAQGCDLIVMASHGRRGIAAVVLGSETVKVLTHSTIPVLVFRAPHYDQLSVAS